MEDDGRSDFDQDDDVQVGELGVVVAAESVAFWCWAGEDLERCVTDEPADGPLDDLYQGSLLSG